jgi:hypothetical protein
MIINSEVFCKSDKHKNILYLRVFKDETKEVVGATIHLKLDAEKKVRHIGNFYIHDRSFHVRRDSAKHYHYKTKSYGFNWNILDDDMLGIKSVHLTIDKADTYVIPVETIGKYGRFLNFKQQGFELQRFMPLELINNFKKEQPTIKEPIF